MIVIAGGSGTLGRLLTSDLLARGHEVRVLVRDPVRARAALGEDVEIVTGDVRVPAGLAPALAGASVVVSAVHGFLGGRGAGPAEVDDRGNANLIAAAAAAGASVVLVSVFGASPNSPIDLFRAKYAAEQHLRGSGTPWTIVRAGPFLDTWWAVLTTTAGRSGRPLVFGRGDQPIPFVSAADVATVVSRAATDSTLRGRVIDVVGDPITMTALAHAVREAHGWQGAPRHLPRTLLRTLAVLARPFSPALARQNRTALAMDTGLLSAAAVPEPLGTP